MSKIGKKPIIVPEGVSVQVEDKKIEIKGPKAQLSVPRLSGIDIELKDNELTFVPKNSSKQTTSNWGTMRALVANAILGSTEGFEKTLAIEGVGYRAAQEGDTLVLNLGYSHQIRYDVPEGITAQLEGNKIKISGFDKALVGETAATIRRFRKPEPYKGKGIRYENEVVRRKSGKKAGSGAA